jgi:hypothetical protein
VPLVVMPSAASTSTDVTAMRARYDRELGHLLLPAEQLQQHQHALIRSHVGE